MENKTKRKSRIRFIFEDIYLEILILYLILFFVAGMPVLAMLIVTLGKFLRAPLRLILGSNLHRLEDIARALLSYRMMGLIGFGLFILILSVIVLVRIRKGIFSKTFLIYNLFKYYNSSFNIYRGLILPIVFSGIIFIYIFFDNWFDFVNIIMLIMISIIGITLLNYGIQISKIMHIIKNIGSMEKIEISEGSASFTIESIRMLDNIDENIKLSIENQLKSERLKTELITNISHDLKTPLTSIINYTDLLKKIDIENETAFEYIEVLDRNSQRLKLLITDLVDASKTETGNVNIDFERLELNELISQVYGEFDSIFEEKEIAFIFNPEEDVYVLSDSVHLGRVLGNIIGNASKYTQDKTRIYGDVRVEGDYVSFTLKNTSKDELNITPDELMEQFVRGERSRHTEGSGLGLYIARNLMKLMHGELSLSINGDLFEVKLLIPKIANR